MNRFSFFNNLLPGLALAAALGLAGCASAPPASGINDPQEAQNRGFHEFNLSLDRAILRPAGRAYVQILPPPLTRGVANFAANLDLPGMVVNDLLQFRPLRAVQNTTRFVLNTTIGLGGLFDPATKAGVDAIPTDFGETLHVWGMPEGAYIEMPVLGPTTDRDLLGTVVDVALNPVRLLVPTPDRKIDVLAKLGSKLGDRGRYSETVDSILYESADGYAQLRLMYLQNRRYQLGQAAGSEDVEDPYAE